MMRLPRFFLAARFAVIVCCGLYFSLAQALELHGRVVAVVDGDTLTLLAADQLRYRITLAGVDAPELPQAFGQKSKTNLSAMVLDQQVTVKCWEGDAYLRATCEVRVGEQDVGLAQINAGLAWWYRLYASKQDAQARAEYEHAEFNAKIRRLGLWDSKNPMPPWRWRRGRLNE